MFEKIKKAFSKNHPVTQEKDIVCKRSYLELNEMAISNLKKAIADIDEELQQVDGSYDIYGELIKTKLEYVFHQKMLEAIDDEEKAYEQTVSFMEDVIKKLQD